MNVKDCIGKKVVYKIISEGNEQNPAIAPMLHEGNIGRLDGELVKIDNQWYYSNSIVVEKVLNEGDADSGQVIEG